MDASRRGSRRPHRAHAQGLRLRPGGALVPRLRRLLHPRPDAEGHARPRHTAREHRVRLGHRLLQPLPVLHEHVRLPHHPRPCADHRHRPQGRATRSQRVGRHRRRRRPVDRRQPLPAHVAPQHGREDPALQQRDLRADQGPVLAHVGARQAHQVHARWDRSTPHRPPVGRHRRRGHVRGPRRRYRNQAIWPTLDRRPPSTAARPSWRSTRTATSSTTATRRR